MEKEFVPYEQALALKELGFEELCIRGWYEGEGIWYHPDSDIILDNPTFSQAFRFFREKYELESWVYKSRDMAYFYSILKEDRYLNPSHQYTDYEEAELECLRKLIEIVKR